ncbi:MAG TPA: transposase [Chloroflexi bacterium]|jgi:REP element-mobilizing transposase RayT|nr:transposase [Chloroflexota bacterium]
MDPNFSSPHRRNLRLPEFDYSQPGAYFVTIVTQDRKQLFGEVVEGEMILNDVGMMVKEVWEVIPDHFPNVELGEFIVMPNHIHGIISITNVEATHASPLPRVSKGPTPESIAAIIGSFKSATSKRIREFKKNHKKRLWQRNYYEHIIRNERDHQAIYDYILANPMNWEKDEENKGIQE